MGNCLTTQHKQGGDMGKEEDFFLLKSDLESKLIEFINICKEVDRDVADELEEVLCNANTECGLKLDISIFND